MFLSHHQNTINWVISGWIIQYNIIALPCASVPCLFTLVLCRRYMPSMSNLQFSHWFFFSFVFCLYLLIDRCAMVIAYAVIPIMERMLHHLSYHCRKHQRYARDVVWPICWLPVHLCSFSVGHHTSFVCFIRIRWATTSIRCIFWSIRFCWVSHIIA